MTDLLTPTPTSPLRSHRARRGAVILAIVLVIVGFVRWRSSLDIVAAFAPTATGPVQVGQTYYIDAGLGPIPDGSSDGPGSVTVTLDRVGAGATLLTTTPGTGTFTEIPIEAVLCVRRPGSNGIGVTASADLTVACSSVRALALPETLALGFDTNQLMYKVPITTIGTYENFGMTVDYHQGIRTGTIRATAGTSLVAKR
jgi:hypothetical protein